MDVGGRLLVDWFEDSVDAEAWLEFSGGDAKASRPASLWQGRSGGGFQL